MGLPRSRYVKEGEEGVYHCYSRCVRRAFLCGFDRLTRRDFSHRRKWFEDRLQYLASIFAIDVIDYSVMENHSHNILRTRPDLVASWSDHEVAARWLELCPRKRGTKNRPIPPLEQQIQALADCPERIAVLRKRLCSLSWFMAQLNQFIARKANKEDNAKGRFWESRFKCQALLDEAAIAACMVYVDLNQIRAGLASTPEDSDFTSIQQRIRAWKKKMIEPKSNAAQTYGPPDDGFRQPKAVPSLEPASTANPSPTSSDSADSWLCPIQSDSRRRGILQMSELEYFDLVDRSGRIIRSDKPGSIDAGLEPILNRIGAIPKAWVETISHFGSSFRLAAGRLARMREFADRLDKYWFVGLSAARSAFN